jgi:hypothetical protein
MPAFGPVKRAFSSSFFRPKFPLPMEGERVGVRGLSSEFRTLFSSSFRYNPSKYMAVQSRQNGSTTESQRTQRGRLILGRNIFVCRYLPTNKKVSLCPRRLCGEIPVLGKRVLKAILNLTSDSATVLCSILLQFNRVSFCTVQSDRCCS